MAARTLTTIAAAVLVAVLAFSAGVAALTGPTLPGPRPQTFSAMQKLDPGRTMHDLQRQVYRHMIPM
jgi:hypothetical protein